MRLFFKKNLIYLLGLTLLTFLVYLNSLDNAFLSDDLPEIVNNPNISNLWYAISAHPVGFIRPLIYWLSYSIAGLNPVIFRLTNILLHLGSIYLIFAIVSFLHSKKTAIFAAAVFAIHPLLVEPVIWISGGSYPQYSFFFLMSFLFYILSDKKRYFYLLSSIFYLLSFMSHPVMPASLILIYLLYEFVFGNLKKNWKKTIPFILILAIYAFINVISLPEREQTLQSVHYQERGIDNPLILVPLAVSSYLNLLFWPKDLTLYHSELNFNLISWSLIFGEFLLFLGLVGIFFKKNKVLFFWLSFFFVTLLPTLTPFRLNWIVAERYVYLGSIGIFTALALILEKVLSKKDLKPWFYIILVILLIPLSARTFLRNIDWHSEDNLWIATGKTSPSSPNTHNNLGDVYGRWGDKQAALREFQTAIALKPNYADAYHNLANTLRELKQLDKALENYYKALEYSPGLWQSYQNIAAIYFDQKQYDLSIQNIQKAIQINPRNINLVNNLGVLYMVKGDKQKAKEVFSSVLAADPQNQFANMGLIEASK